MKVYALVTLAILSFIIASCSSKLANVTKESYSIHIRQSNSINPIVYGYLFEYGTEFAPAISFVEVDDQLKSKANPKSGQYSISIKPGKHRFVAYGLGYYPTKTRKVKVSKGDSIQINFYLKVDETALHD